MIPLAANDTTRAGGAHLSAAHRRTRDALFRHPLAHNLDWNDVLGLFEALGSVEPKGHSEVSIRIGSEHHAMRKPHTKDMTSSEVIELRHFLSRAGYADHIADTQETS